MDLMPTLKARAVLSCMLVDTGRGHGGESASDIKGERALASGRAAERSILQC